MKIRIHINLSYPSIFLYVIATLQKYRPTHAYPNEVGENIKSMAGAWGHACLSHGPRRSLHL